MPRPAPRPTPPTRRGRARPRARGEAGSVSVEIAILFPALLLLITALVQYALWFHARSVALAAAQEGVTAVASYGAAPGSGADRARSFLGAHGADTLTGPQVTETAPAAGHVTVHVTGRSVSVLPGVPGPAVAQSAQAPIERFTLAGAP